MDIERVSAISAEQFEREYLCAKRPVVVTDALTDWDLAGRWTPRYFRREYGEREKRIHCH